MEVGEKASGKTDLGKILQEIAWQSQRPISKMRVVLLSTGWRQFNFSAAPLLQSRLENGEASSLPTLIPTFLINAHRVDAIFDRYHPYSIKGGARTNKERAGASGSLFVWFCFENGIIITQRQYSVMNC